MIVAARDIDESPELELAGLLLTGAADLAVSDGEGFGGALCRFLAIAISQ